MTSKQRAYLRKLAVNIDTIMQVGKDGITDNMAKAVSDALEARELIKIKTLENSSMTPREAADALSAAVKADVITVIGSKFVLYRESVNNKKIVLE